MEAPDPAPERMLRAMLHDELATLCPQLDEQTTATVVEWAFHWVCGIASLASGGSEGPPAPCKAGLTPHNEVNIVRPVGTP